MHPGITSCVLNSAGAGTATIQHNKTGFFWRIHQLVVDSTGPSLTVEVQVNGKALCSKVTAAAPVAASGEPSVDIGDHDVMTVLVTSGGAGNNITVSYWFEEIAGAA